MRIYHRSPIRLLTNTQSHTVPDGSREVCRSRENDLPVGALRHSRVVDETEDEVVPRLVEEEESIQDSGRVDELVREVEAGQGRGGQRGGEDERREDSSASHEEGVYARHSGGRELEDATGEARTNSNQAGTWTPTDVSAIPFVLVRASSKDRS